MHKHTFLPFISILFVFSFITAAEEMEGLEEMEFSLDDLMQVEVLSNTKFSQELSEIPAAVYIIDKQDIQLSGASTLPDLLEQVPGLLVAPASSNTYAVGARGFAGVFANKLLVMIDGRSLFSPLFSGVFWEMHDFFLADIKRIEIIRGSGSSTWGANAINGIINIITESSADTVNTLGYVRAGGNTEHDVGIRQGFEIGSQSFGRLYVKQMDFASNRTLVPGVLDSWQSKAVGGKLDWFSGSNSWSLSADSIVQESSDIMILPIASTQPVNNSDNKNWNISGSWQKIVNANNQFSLGAYVQEQSRDGFSYESHDRMYNLEYDQTLNFNHTWQMNFGVSGRKHEISMASDEVFTFAQGALDVEAYVYSGYFLFHYNWDEKQAVELGTKLENHQHDLVTNKGTENFDETYWLPNLRYINKISDKMSLWLSINHSPRVPSIAEHNMDVQLTSIPPLTATNPSPWLVEVRFIANPELKSEKATSLELGLRSQINTKLNFDLSLFLTEFDDVRATMPDGHICRYSQQAVPNCLPDDRIITRLKGTNGIKADSHGLEIYGDWAVSRNVNVKLAYSYLDVTFKAKSPEIVVGATGLIFYRHQTSLLAYWQINNSHKLKLAYKYLDGLNQSSESEQLIEPSIHQLDLVHSYQFSSNYKLNLELKNLFNHEKRQWFAESPTGHASLSQQEIRLGLEVQF